MPEGFGRMAGLPFQDVVLPISSEGKLTEVKHALQRIDAGTEFINWWNAVVAEDIVLPVKLISNSANCSCFHHLLDYTCRYLYIYINIYVIYLQYIYSYINIDELFL